MNCFEEYLNLKKEGNKNNKYAPFFKAISETNNMVFIDNYYNEEKGIFVKANIKINLPSRGIYKNLDIHKIEEVFFYLPSKYPFIAPSVFFNRMDIPYEKLPHLNMSISETGINIPNLCLYRGDINEWFYRSFDRDTKFIALVNEWIEDAVTGELMKGDGFETIRRNDDPTFMVIANFDYLKDIIESNDSDKVCRFISAEGLGGKVLRVNNHEFNQHNNREYPCILICNRSSLEQDYISNIVKNIGDLKNLKSVNLLQHAVLKFRNKYYKDASNEYNNQIIVIVGIKRPEIVIGSSSEYEFLALMIDFDMKYNPNIYQCTCSIGVLISDCSIETAKRISGTTCNLKSVAIIGCGAIGSNVSMMLAKMGIAEQHLIDNDILMPHNLVRHYADNGLAIGMYKVAYQKLAIDSVYNNELVHVNKNNIIDISPESITEDIIIDCSASEIVFDWLCNETLLSKKVIRTELVYNGRLGITLVESNFKKNSVGDLRTYLWYKSLENEFISEWLSDEAEGKEAALSQLQIGLGCSSDTMILDNATILYHTSIVPNILSQNYNSTIGKIIVSYYNKVDMTKNRIYSFDVEPFIELNSANNFKIRIYEPVFKKVINFLNDMEENAGLWIGSINYKTNTIYIVDTFIPTNNIRSKLKVVRGDAGVADFMEKIEQSCSRYIYYLGEWHTHPESSPCLSSIDKNTFDTMCNVKGKNTILLMTIFGKSKTQNYVI